MGGVWSGGLVVLAAAALWLVYLIPTWLRRREYLATERNAVRLQQTLRILAETSEVPQQVRLEANARTVAEQQKVLREAEARAAAVARAQADAKAAEDALAAAQATARAQATAAAARAAMPVVRMPVVRMPAVRIAAAASPADSPVTSAAAGPMIQTVRASQPITGTEAVGRRRRIRRARASVSLVLLLSLLGAGFGVYAVLALATWLVLAGALVVALGCVITLSSLARSTRRAAVVRLSAPARAATELFDHADHAETAAEVPATTWTPRPLPKPLYQSQGTVAAGAMASVDAAAALRRSAAAADLARRAAELAPPVPLLRPAVAPAEEPAAAAPSRFASMGIVTGAEGASIDLDAALRRRRTAG